MKDTFSRWLELNTALFLYTQQQWESYFLSMGDDFQHLRDENRDVYNNILEVLKKNLDRNRTRFLDFIAKQLESPFTGKKVWQSGTEKDPIVTGLTGMMRAFHRSFAASGQLETEVYDIMAEFWNNITKNIHRQRDIESIDPDVLNESLKQFNEDIRAIVVLNKEDRKERNSPGKGKKRTSSGMKRESK